MGGREGAGLRPLSGFGGVTRDEWVGGAWAGATEAAAEATARAWSCCCWWARRRSAASFMASGENWAGRSGGGIKTFVIALMVNSRLSDAMISDALKTFSHSIQDAQNMKI